MEPARFELRGVEMLPPFGPDLPNAFSSSTASNPIAESDLRVPGISVASCFRTHQSCVPIRHRASTGRELTPEKEARRPRRRPCRERRVASDACAWSPVLSGRGASPAAPFAVAPLRSGRRTDGAPSYYASQSSTVTLMRAASKRSPAGRVRPPAYVGPSRPSRHRRSRYSAQKTKSGAGPP